jgi:hypothetical protein
VAWFLAGSPNPPTLACHLFPTSQLLNPHVLLPNSIHQPESSTACILLAKTELRWLSFWQGAKFAPPSCTGHFPPPRPSTSVYPSPTASPQLESSTPHVFSQNQALVARFWWGADIYPHLCGHSIPTSQPCKSIFAHPNSFPPMH